MIYVLLGLTWLKSMLYWCFFWDFSSLWSFHKTTIASTVPNKVCKVATWCASDRADAFSTAPATHSGDLSFFPILISLFFKERNFKDSTGWRSQHWNSILRGLGYFYVTTSCRKRSGDFQISEIFFCENSEAPGLMLVGSDRSVAAILPPGRMLWPPKFSRLQQLQKLGEST